MSLFKDTLRKVPWWAWVLFPIALVVAVVLFFRRGSGPGGLLSLPPAEAGSPGPPALTPEAGEEKKEEVHLEAEAERERIDEKYEDETAKKADELRELLK